MSNERRTPVQAIRVERFCATNDCAGMLVSTGESFTQFDTSYKHMCNRCHRTEFVKNQTYPRIEYENLK